MKFKLTDSNETKCFGIQYLIRIFWDFHFLLKSNFTHAQGNQIVGILTLHILTLCVTELQGDYYLNVTCHWKAIFLLPLLMYNEWIFHLKKLEEIWELVPSPFIILKRWQYNVICQFLIVDVYCFWLSQ